MQSNTAQNARSPPSSSLKNILTSRQKKTVGNTKLDKKELDKKDPLYVVVHSTNS